MFLAECLTKLCVDTTFGVRAAAGQPCVPDGCCHGDSRIPIELLPNLEADTEGEG